MHALVRGAAATGILAALSALLPPRFAPDPGSADAQRGVELRKPGEDSPPARAGTSSLPPSAGAAEEPCPARHVPAGESAAGRAGCVPVPSPTAPLRSARLERLATEQSRASPVRWTGRDSGIPRLPGRPERYEDYELPVEDPGLVSPAAPSDLGGDELERWLRGEGRFSAEPVGIRIESSADAPVTLVELEGQQGNAEVVLAGELYGITVATRHRVDTGSGVRDYVALYGQLSRPGSDLSPGTPLARGAVVGFVGDRNGSDTPHLYFELRQLRHATRAAAAVSKTLGEIVRPATSVPCDPRNVLPLR